MPPLLEGALPDLPGNAIKYISIPGSAPHSNPLLLMKDVANLTATLRCAFLYRPAWHVKAIELLLVWFG